MRIGLALVAAAACVSGTAYAEGLRGPFTSHLPYEMTLPGYFDGPYAGVTLGMAGADHGNFWPAGDIDRFGVGAIAGWSTYVAPGIVVGAEVQGHIDTDTSGIVDIAALALGRLGFTTSESFLIHVLAGGGVFGSLPAWAFGAGFEFGFHEDVALRADIITLGEAGANPMMEGITAWIIKGGPVWHFGGEAPRAHAPFDRGTAPVTDYEGAYVGLGYGIHIDPTWHFFPDTGNGLHLTRGHLGGFAGWSLRLADGVIVGAEGQADLLFDTSGDMTYDALALARVGVVPMEGLLVYGAGGVGVLQEIPAYALGGGIEYALWGNSGLRLESLALADATGGADGFVASKTTVGAVWHLD